MTTVSVFRYALIVSCDLFFLGQCINKKKKSTAFNVFLLYLVTCSTEGEDMTSVEETRSVQAGVNASSFIPPWRKPVCCFMLPQHTITLSSCAHGDHEERIRSVVVVVAQLFERPHKHK